MSSVNVRYYLPRLSDRELNGLAWMGGRFVYKRSRKLAVWTINATRIEAVRRSSPEPLEVTIPELPVGTWSDREVADATNCTWGQAGATESQNLGEFYDALLFVLMAESSARLRGKTNETARLCHASP